MKRFFTRLTRVFSEPKMIIGKFKGFYPNQCYSILTARRFVNEDFKTIIDVGANYGYFLKPSKWLFPNALIYGFEPTTEAYNKIKNINGIELFNIGLGKENGSFDFYYNPKSEGDNTFLKPTDEYIKENGNTIKRNAILKRFDSLNLKIKRPCFVKIDTEGFEYNVLKGFGNRLKEVDVIQFEYHFKNYFENRSKLSDIIRLLETFGFNKLIQTEFHNKGCDLMFSR